MPGAGRRSKGAYGSKTLKGERVFLLSIIFLFQLNFLLAGMHKFLSLILKAIHFFHVSKFIN